MFTSNTTHPNFQVVLCDYYIVSMYVTTIYLNSMSKRTPDKKCYNWIIMETSNDSNQTWGQALSKGLKSKPKALSEGLKPKPFY